MQRFVSLHSPGLDPGNPNGDPIMNQTLTSDELAALRAFAAEHGRYWKAHLADVYWYHARVWREPTGCHGYHLHGLRNRLGPQWLKTFKLTKETK
jgi:hypothetical protein